MSKEWFDTTGMEWRPGAIRQQYYEFMKPNVRKSDICKLQKPDYETCAISDLERLIEANKKMGDFATKPPINQKGT